MRCRKAKAKIDKANWRDPDLLEHLKICPSCSKLASAQAIFESAARNVRTEMVSEASDLGIIIAKLATRQSAKEPSTMFKFKSAVKNHPRIGFGTAVFLMAVLFLTLVPLPYQRLAGYDVSFAGIEGVLPQEQLIQAMNALGYGHIGIKVMASEKAADYTFLNVPTMKAAKEVAAAFATLSGTSVSPSISPKFESVSASLYAQARNRMVKIEVNGDGKTDEQIKAEIESKLAAQGLGCTLVYLKTDSTGNRQINLQIEESDSCHSNPGPPIEIDPRGKTDEQIKAEVESRLAAQGHPGAQVNIHSDGADSSRKVEIEIQDTTGH